MDGNIHTEIEVIDSLIFKLYQGDIFSKVTTPECHFLLGSNTIFNNLLIKFLDYLEFSLKFSSKPSSIISLPISEI